MGEAKVAAGLIPRVSHHLGRPVRLLEVRRRASGIESLLLEVGIEGGESVRIDVAHVDTFEESTWEPAPADRRGLVGARGHTMHSRRGRVEFRPATWVEDFDAASIAVALERRLAALATERQAGNR